MVRRLPTTHSFVAFVAIFPLFALNPLALQQTIFSLGRQQSDDQPQNLLTAVIPAPILNSTPTPSPSGGSSISANANNGRFKCNDCAECGEKMMSSARSLDVATFPKNSSATNKALAKRNCCCGCCCW